MPEIPELPAKIYNTDKSSPDYNPYKDPMSVFFGMDENFIPTPEKPLQSPMCSKISPTGEMCLRRAVLGTGYAGTQPLCEKHGGNNKQVRERAKDIVEAARLTLTSSVPSALDRLIKLATDPSIQQNVQLSAIKEILDRSGVKHEETKKIEVEVTQSYKGSVEEKLKALAMREAHDGEEVLEDLGEQ